MNDCIRNKAGILIGLFTLLGCFAVRAQNIAVKTNLLYGGLLQTPNNQNSYCHGNKTHKKRTSVY